MAQRDARVVFGPGVHGGWGDIEVCLWRGEARGERALHDGRAAFAVGCLLATAFYLLLIEASLLLAVSYQTEVQGNWRFGTCVLAGYLLGMVSAAADPSHLYVADDCEEPCCQIEDGGGPESSDIVKADPVEGRPARKVDASFCFAIFLSDFLHNFVDGIFIANAFLDCQQSKGWTVASSTVAHELAQEVRDFFHARAHARRPHDAFAAGRERRLGRLRRYWGLVVFVVGAGQRRPRHAAGA